jgi:hypothetical protein
MKHSLSVGETDVTPDESSSTIFKKPARPTRVAILSRAVLASMFDNNNKNKTTKTKNNTRKYFYTKNKNSSHNTAAFSSHYNYTLYYVFFDNLLVLG